MRGVGESVVTAGFRVAREASPAWNLAKTFAQIVVFWSTFLYVLPAGMRWVEAAIGVAPVTLRGQWAVGVALFLACSALGIWSAVTMAWRGGGTPLPVDAPRRMVISGPYRFIRNPMALAGLGQGMAVAIATGSWLTVAYVLAGGLMWNGIARPLEEADLRERFGVEFEAYCREVKCWWPRLRVRRRVG
ncbi:MAG: isoprenylcysteine carboxylmethyltransferase family protein [Blastocatellia bacterium]|nr:isoprenylcysteine carboxylmethyltransferase family protein [Blastocatellia bacterium]